MWKRCSSERLVGDVIVRAPFVHSGDARSAILALKYSTGLGWADRLGRHMVPLLPPDCRMLVPIPRNRVRVGRFGVDPALELARVISRRTGKPVARLLVPPIWAPRHAGRRLPGRPPPRFRTRSATAGGIVLVDDVLTTGSTISSAAAALGPAVVGAVTATMAT